MKISYVSIVAMALALFSCKASEEMGDSPKAEIIFGSGGGFTGAVHTYHISKSGQLFEVNSLAKAPHPITTVDKKRVKDLFKQMKALGIESDTFNAPGNMYKFVGLIDHGKEFRITWGAPGQEPPAGYKAMYDSLIAIVPKKHD